MSVDCFQSIGCHSAHRVGSPRHRRRRRGARTVSFPRPSVLPFEPTWMPSLILRPLLSCFPALRVFRFGAATSTSWFGGRRQRPRSACLAFICTTCVTPATPWLRRPAPASVISWLGWGTTRRPPRCCTSTPHAPLMRRLLTHCPPGFRRLEELSRDPGRSRRTVLMSMANGALRISAGSGMPGNGTKAPQA